LRRGGRGWCIGGKRRSKRRNGRSGVIASSSSRRERRRRGGRRGGREDRRRRGLVDVAFAERTGLVRDEPFVDAVAVVVMPAWQETNNFFVLVI
jgi:hypothetical protein